MYREQYGEYAYLRQVIKGLKMSFMINKSFCQSTQ